jgi:hypothetical protein
VVAGPKQAMLSPVIETDIEKGVKYVEANIESIVFDEDGAAAGVRSTKGNVLCS